MHRNVTRHLTRQRRQCAPPGNTPYQQHRQLFSTSTHNPSQPGPSEPDNPEENDPSTPQTGQWRHDPDKMRELLQHLDQKTLLDTKFQLNALIAKYEHALTSIPALLPPSLPNPYSRKGNPRYTLSLQRARVDALPAKVNALVEKIKHTRAHIEDLQTEDYVRPGDGLAAWREEIESLTMEERRDRLVQMRWDEEAELGRGMDDARRAKELVEGLNRRTAEAVGEFGAGGRVRRRGGMRFERKEGEGSEGKEAGGGKSGEGKAEGKEKGQQARKPQEMSLSDMQRRLAEDMMR